AGLAVVEAHDAPGRAHHATAVVHDDHRARAEHGAGSGHRLLVEVQVELVGADPEGGGPTGHDGPQGPPGPDTAAQLGVEDEVTEGRLVELDLVVAGTDDVAGQGEHARAGGGRRPQGGEGGAPVGDDPRQRGHRLDVVDDGGLAVEAGDGRVVGRLHAGEAALALQALQEGGLVPADVGAGAGMDD